MKPDDARFAALVRLGKRLYPGFRFKWPQMDWVSSAGFNAYLERFGEHDGLNTERRWMLAQLMRLVQDVPGHTAECGVFQGAGSYLMCSMNEELGGRRTHYLFDSFEGISAPGSADGGYWTKGDLACGEDRVRGNLAPFANYSIHKGWIPECFDDASDQRFAFVHIDVDLYEPTRDSLAFFYDRLNPGGVIVCDDFGFSTCPGATLACREFLNDRPEKMIALASGGGFLIKGTKTCPERGLGAL
jgi:hypothetical protein